MPAISTLLHHPPSPLEPWPAPVFDAAKIKVWIKRDDLLRMGPGLALCGNKWRKLKYNLSEAQSEGHTIILTFGGAYSNHIAAVAGAGRAFGFKTIGVIRGEAPPHLNPTLRFARNCGMSLHFISRTAFRQKEDPSFLAKLEEQYGRFYKSPEGGTNEKAIDGARDIIKETLAQAPWPNTNYWCVSAGTGGTAAGMILEAPADSKVLAFSALKGDFLKKAIESYTGRPSGKSWDLITGYHFGGYAKFETSLLNFINQFYHDYGIPLDPIYTGKLFYGLSDLASCGYFPEGSNIIAVHTGGLQGIAGFNERFGDLLQFDA